MNGGAAALADYPQIVTVLDRIVDAGVARHHAERYLRYGRVRVDGRPVTDPHVLVAADAEVTLRRRPRTVETLRAS